MIKCHTYVVAMVVLYNIVVRNMLKSVFGNYLKNH